MKSNLTAEVGNKQLAVDKGYSYGNIPIQNRGNRRGKYSGLYRDEENVINQMTQRR